MGTIDLSLDNTLYSCGKCYGVFTEELLREAHKGLCDGTVRTSDAETFLCPRKNYVKVCADIFNLITPKPGTRKRGRPRKVRPDEPAAAAATTDSITDPIDAILESHDAPDEALYTADAAEIQTIDTPLQEDASFTERSYSEHNYTMTHSASTENTQGKKRKLENIVESPTGRRRSTRGYKPKVDGDYVSDSLVDLKSKPDQLPVPDDEEEAAEEGDSGDIEWKPDTVLSPSTNSGNTSDRNLSANGNTDWNFDDSPYRQYQKRSTKGTRSSSKITFDCPKCNRKVPNSRDFAKHLESCSGHKEPRDASWKKACEESFKHLMKETTTEDGEKKYVYTCDVCSKTLYSAGMMQRHMTTTHSQVWRCDECEQTFVNKNKLQLHMDKHIKPHMCEFCSQRFSQKKDMIRHTWTHTEEYPFKCTECDYKCRYVRALNEHMRSHTGNLIKCEVDGCNFVTQWSAAYTAHKAAKHEEQTRFSCERCEYKTNAKGCFDKHVKTHLGLKNFKCSMCAYRAVQKSDIIKHIKKKHMKQKSYYCDRCMFSTSYSHGFRTHMMQHLGVKPWQCSLCGYNSITKQKLLRHLQNRHPDQNGECINLGLKLDIKFSQYCRPAAAESRLPEVSFKESDGTVNVLLQEKDENEAEPEEDQEPVSDVEENLEESEQVQFVTEETDNENVVYIFGDVDDSSMEVITGDEVVTTSGVAASQGADPEGTTIELQEASEGHAIQIQTEDGTILNISDLASIPGLSQAINSSTSQTFIIQESNVG